MPFFGPSKTEAALFGEKADPLRSLYDKYWSHAKPPPEKELVRAMLKAGYAKEVILAGMQRNRKLRKSKLPKCLQSRRNARKSGRAKQQSRILHSKYAGDVAAQKVDDL